MTILEEEIESKNRNQRTVEPQPIVVRATPPDFQCEVLEKLGRLETKIDMLVGNGQPGRMRLAEERISALERSDIRRSVYDRVVNAVIAFAVSAAIAMHDHLGFK